MNSRRIARLLVLICLLLMVIPAMAAYTAYTGPCPIGTSGAPQLIDPGLTSGALCRGACGMDCPDERCDLLTDSTGAATPITIGLQNPRGICTYNNVLECPTHQGCQIHDNCFDVCTEHYHMNSMTDTCHMNCNLDCVGAYGLTNCVLWADAPTAVYNSQFTAAMGYIMDYTTGVDFSGYYFYSDPPVFTPLSPTPTKTPTTTPTTRPETSEPTTVPETSVPTTTPSPTKTLTSTGSMAEPTEPPIAVQRQTCASYGGHWDESSQGCIIPDTTAPPTTGAPIIGIPDIFKEKPVIQYTADDFKDAADDAVNAGKSDLAIQYYDAAEDKYLKDNPDKDSRPADVDRSLSAIESAKAKVYHSMPGHETDETAANQNAKDLQAEAVSRESSSDLLPGFEAPACLMAFGLLFIVWRRKK